jgi:hypothetical protein
MEFPAIERLGHRILAAYTLRRNAQGLLYEIQHQAPRAPAVADAGDLDARVDAPVAAELWREPGVAQYHNQEFVSACEAIGLHPAIGSGVHLRPADGLFAQFLRVYGVPEPEPMAEPKTTPKGRPVDWWVDPEKRRRGRSTMRAI